MCLCTQFTSFEMISIQCWSFHMHIVRLTKGRTWAPGLSSTTRSPVNSCSAPPEMGPQKPPLKHSPLPSLCLTTERKTPSAGCFKCHLRNPSSENQSTRGWFYISLACTWQPLILLDLCWTNQGARCCDGHLTKPRNYVKNIIPVQNSATERDLYMYIYI